MFLLTLLGGFVTLMSVAALVYAYRSAADGQEDAAGFHYDQPRRAQVIDSIVANRHGNAHEHEASSVVMGSHPAA